MAQEKVANRPAAIWRWLMKIQNPFMIRLLQSPLHGMVSNIYLLLTITGRKSGKRYQIPVQYRQDGECLYIITSAGYTWWKNLRGGAAVDLYWRGMSYRGYAQVSTDSALIADYVRALYPNLSTQRQQQFMPGKVAITVTVQPTAA